MIKITEQQYMNSNIDNNYYLGLDIDSKQRYLNYYSYYYNYLIQYIKSLIEMDKIDNILINSKNNYKKVSEDKMDIYQYLNSEYFSYVYIRNNIYIQRLNSEEINQLTNFINSNIETINQEIIDFITKTISKVITENPEMSNETMINYGPLEMQYFSQNSSIVMGLRYEDDNVYTNPNYIELKNEREKELDLLMDIIKIKYVPIVKEKLNIGFNVINYNDYSVKTIKNNVEQTNNIL